MLQDLSVLSAACWPYMLLTAVTAYLLGSINFAILITRAISKEDIRNVGSGNAGMTNVLRSQGKLPAVLTTAGDVGKSVAAGLFGGWLMEYALTQTGVTVSLTAEQVAVMGRYIAGLFCVLGHLFPLYFHFRGGKGVLAAFGMLLVLDWRVALIALGVFLVVLAGSRMVSLGSLCGTAAAVVVTWLFDRFVYGWEMGVTLFCTLSVGLIAALIFVRHHGNIQRICRGEERKLSFGQKKEK